MIEKTDFVTTLFEGHDNPNKVTVAFTLALNALKKGHSATLVLMVDAVHLGKRGAAAAIDVGAPFQPLSALLASFLELGGCVAVCAACIQHQGLSEAEMDSRFPIISGADVVDLLMGAQGSLQVT